ncbi:MAG TPA: hypothetical protein VMH83_08045 [Candidatus Acidoferrum sp.]|nr:hypothetical protein [Candidatus Acidoferrum sp.]
MHRLLSLALITAALAVPVADAQTAPRSKPTAQPLTDTIPAARDRAYPGTMVLNVDASDTVQRIWRIRQTIPVTAAGTLTLLYPEWLPGHHAPRGQIEKVAGLHVSANGKELAWKRNSLDVFAFQVDVPAGAKELQLEFQFLNPTADNQGRITVTDKLLNLEWDAVSFYPAGYYVRQIPVQATVTYPAGWQAFSALRGELSGAVIKYEKTDYETLIDSPVFAGKYARSDDLGSNVHLDVVADSAKELEATPEQIDKHKKLIQQALTLFGAHHFDHYDLLLAISNELGGVGLEHHRSSENGVDPGYFIKWNDALGDRYVMPHELTHSWNGKFRRPALLWTPDYRTQMQDDLLWVYEGQTQFWGYVLDARSGLYSKDETLDAIAVIAARLDLAKGREWRPLADTTHDPIIAARRPKGWTSWQRSEDYYNEGLLVWLEADAIIRRESKGQRGLDDFARAFFGMRDGDFGELTYTRDDVIKALNAVQPYDWAGFLAARIDATSSEAPKNGITLGGYRLTYGDTPNSITRDSESFRKNVDQSFGIGMAISNAGDVTAVVWDSAAFKAGLTTATRVVAINGVEYSGDGFKEALKQAQTSKQPIQFLLKQGKNYVTVPISYTDGVRYPKLEKTGDSDGSLDKLLQPRS